MTFYEGGTHVPFFMRWPDRIEAGSEYQRPVTHIDIFSTAAAAAKVSVPDDREIDGVDLVPYINGEIQGDPHEAIFWRTGTYRAVRSGDWKLQLSDPDGTAFLFNLKVDPTEENNLSGSEPGELDRLKRLGMVEAIWGQNKSVEQIREILKNLVSVINIYLEII